MMARFIGIAAAVLITIGTGKALGDEALARRSGCLECHSPDKKVPGPTFDDIATRYKGDARARDVLIETIKKGGKGNWTHLTGGMPMPPYSPRLSDAEIERLADFVLRR